MLTALDVAYKRLCLPQIGVKYDLSEDILRNISDRSCDHHNSLFLLPERAHGGSVDVATTVSSVGEATRDTITCCNCMRKADPSEFDAYDILFKQYTTQPDDLGKVNEGKYNELIRKAASKKDADKKKAKDARGPAGEIRDLEKLIQDNLQCHMYNHYKAQYDKQNEAHRAKIDEIKSKHGLAGGGGKTRKKKNKYKRRTRKTKKRKKKSRRKSKKRKSRR
jgi:hypothetical protein